jgi:hypothetical protein
LFVSFSLPLFHFFPSLSYFQYRSLLQTFPVLFIT